MTTLYFRRWPTKVKLANSTGMSKVDAANLLYNIKYLFHDEFTRLLYLNETIFLLQSGHSPLYCLVKLSSIVTNNRQGEMGIIWQAVN